MIWYDYSAYNIESTQARLRCEASPSGQVDESTLGELIMVQGMEERTMAWTDSYRMKRGNVLVTVNGFFGEEDFYELHKTAVAVLDPEDAGYSVDSMCIGGFLKKEGILLRTSSECPYDTCCFFYNEEELNEKDREKVNAWIDSIVACLHESRSK